MRLTKSNIEKLEATGTRYEVRDDGLKGFVVRVGATGDKAFYYVYRAGKGRSALLKRLHIGNFPNLTVEQARQIVQKRAATVALGADPAKEVKEAKTALLMQEALQLFQDEHLPKIKPSTSYFWARIIKKNVLPNLGKLRIMEVSYPQVAKLHHFMKETPSHANNTIAILSVFFKWCERQGYRERNTNPCQDIKKYREQPRLEFMGVTELAILGETLERMEQSSQDIRTRLSAAAIRLLMFTGARKNEILSLEWDRIDLEQGIARLQDSKTGFKVLQLPAPALAVMKSLPRLSKWVFPSCSKTGHMQTLHYTWHALLKQAGLSGWRLHDLRHAFASLMVNGGASLPIVGKILGHSRVATTQRYAHLEENPARKAAEEAAAKIAQAWTAKPTSNVLQFPKAQ